MTLLRNKNLSLLILTMLFNQLPVFSQIQFSQYISIPTGSSAEVVAINDVNNDGRKDVVLVTDYYVDTTNDYKVFVFLQNSARTLNVPIKYSYLSMNIHVKSLAVTDMNNDNLNDVIIGGDGKIGIFYQNSLGILNAPIIIPLNVNVENLKITDLDNDGKNDIVVATNYYNTNISILYQTTIGNFQTATYPKPNSTLTEIEIGDINNDNKKDLVFISSNPNEGIFVYTQNSTNTFNPFITYSETNINGIAVGDLNNDGKNDVVASKGGNRPNSKIAIWYQNPTTNLLNNPIEIAAYDIPEPIEIGDLNNDGKNEIVTINGGWMNASVYEQNSSNLFTNFSMNAIPYASHYEKQGLAIGDINSDGRKDIAIADYNNGLVILYNTSNLDINDNTFEKESFILYPNPARDQFSIKTNISENCHFELTDINGKVLLSENLINMKPIDISQLHAGMYFVTIAYGNTKQTFKVIKQ